MTEKYARIDEDTVQQTEPIVYNFRQSETQSSIDEMQKTLDEMPNVRQYLPGATDEEKHLIDEWNIENSNKFEKERLEESIGEQKKFLDMLKGVE